jgi:hypothetical protein
MAALVDVSLIEAKLLPASTEIEHLRSRITMIYACADMDVCLPSLLAFAFIALTT